MARLGIDQFIAFFRWYKGLPHQDLAIAELWRRIPVSLLEEDADWIQTWRDPAIEEDPEVPVVLSGKEPENSWGGVLAAARKAGAKFPEVVAAQAVLESGWFAHETGHFNILGVKAAAGESYSTCTTWEEMDGKEVTIQARFKDFDSYQECVEYVVTRWYLDWNGYSGVNRAQSVGECCNLLVQEGYCTDSNYAAKLMRIINQQADVK